MFNLLKMQGWLLALQPQAQRFLCYFRRRKMKWFSLFVSGLSWLQQWSWVPWTCAPACHSLCWTLFDCSAGSGVQTPRCLWWGNVRRGWHPFYSSDRHTHAKNKKRKQRRIFGKDNLLLQHLFYSICYKLHDKYMVLTWILSRRILPWGLGLMYSLSGAVAWPSICVQRQQTYNIVTNN